MTERERKQLQELGEYARSFLRRLEIQARIDAARREQDGDAPMLGEATWHVHDQNNRGRP